MRELLRLIKDRQAVISVIGLGTVGLPLAATLAEAGFRVHGVDVDEDRVQDINASRVAGGEPGLAPLVARAVGTGRLTAHADYGFALSRSQIAIVCVPTPVKDGSPSYLALLRALTGISLHMPKRGLIIIESTLSPGTMRRVVESAVRHLSPYLAHCPERISPGNVVRCLYENSRVVGGTGLQAAKLAASLYEAVLPKSRIHLTDAVTAEFVKCAENAYRDVQIALANEFEVICESIDVDFWEARDLINTSPGRNLLRAGPGVGGACLPKDSYLLVHDVPFTPIISAARKTNEYRYRRIAYLVQRALAAGGVEEESPRIALLGLTYKPDIDVVLNSPSYDVMAELSKGTAVLRWHDPYVTDMALLDVLRDADCAVLMVAHSAYRELDWQQLGTVMRYKILVDCTGTVWPKPDGFTLRGIGRVEP